MEQFKLRDIEEFDNAFRKFIEEKEAKSISKDNLIPKLNNAEQSNAVSPNKQEEDTPLIEKERQEIFKKVIEDNSEYEEDEKNTGKTKENNDEPKSIKGLAAVKIVMIVFLALTVLAFVLGCFVSIFLDNDGLDIGGYCFNTQSVSTEQLGVKQGDLIISKKVDINGYNSNDVVCVPSADGNGCEIQIVKNTYQNGPDQFINTISIDNGYAIENSVQHSQCYGLVKRYVPAVGKAINFAMRNAILVCILFVLVAVLWCIILVLLENKISKLKGIRKIKHIY